MVTAMQSGQPSQSAGQPGMELEDSELPEDTETEVDDFVTEIDWLLEE